MKIQILPQEDFNSFMEHYKNDALAVDLEKELQLVYNILEQRRTKLEATNSESVMKEIKQIAEKAINDFESKIILYWMNNIKGKRAFYKNHTPRVFVLMKTYYEYQAIYNKAKEKINAKKNEKTIQPDKTNKEVKLIDLFENTGKYYEVMDVLSNSELIEIETNFWASSMGGDKILLASIIKSFERFLKENVKLTNKIVMLVCKNTFNKKVSIDTVKRAKPELIDIRIKEKLDKVI